MQPHYQYVNPDKVLLWENTRREVRARIVEEWRALTAQRPR